METAAWQKPLTSIFQPELSWIDALLHQTRGSHLSREKSRFTSSTLGNTRWPSRLAIFTNNKVVVLGIQGFTQEQILSDPRRIKWWNQCLKLKKKNILSLAIVVPFLNIFLRAIDKPLPYIWPMTWGTRIWLTHLKTLHFPPCLSHSCKTWVEMTTRYPQCMAKKYLHVP